MTSSAIICEFNPLHSGHKYIMDRARSLTVGAPLICLMSGNFVQRGEPAVFSKWARARAALLCGADLVLELPTLYAASSAEYFATGAVSILNSTAAVEQLFFGVEAESFPAVESYVAARMSDEKAFFADAGRSWKRVLPIAAPLPSAPIPAPTIVWQRNISAH